MITSKTLDDTSKKTSIYVRHWGGGGGGGGHYAERAWGEH